MHLSVVADYRTVNAQQASHQFSGINNSSTAIFFAISP